jgi:hypothetical protein
MALGRGTGLLTASVLLRTASKGSAWLLAPFQKPAIWSARNLLGVHSRKRPIVVFRKQLFLKHPAKALCQTVSQDVVNVSPPPLWRVCYHSNVLFLSNSGEQYLSFRYAALIYGGPNQKNSPKERDKNVKAVGVIFGRDLVYESGWRGDRKVSQDPVVKNSRGEVFLTLVKQTYRVLLTRGVKGCYLFFEDSDTKDFFLSRMRTEATNAMAVVSSL